MEVCRHSAARTANAAEPKYRSTVGRAVQALALAGLFLGSQATAFAQDSTRRELIDDLLRKLQETESQRIDQPLPSSFDTRSLPANIDQADIRRAIQTLEDFASEASRLTDDLYNARQRIPGVQTYFNDVLKIRARSSALLDKARRSQDTRVIATEFQLLDQDWRILATRLTQIPGLSQSIIARVERLNAYDREIGKALSIRPQLNRTELIRQTAALASDLNNLLEDISIEIRQPDTRSDLLRSGRRAEQQARRVSTLVADYVDYDFVVDEYRQFQRLWDPLETQLRSVDNRFLERGARRVGETDHAIHELLWLPQTVDRRQLLYLTEVLRRNIDEFFSRTPLRLLISLPESTEVLTTADEFYGMCQNFEDAVTRNEDDLVYTYRFIDEGWHRFHDVFRPLRSQAALQVLAEIERSVMALQSELRIREGFDQGHALELAASLENLTDHLYADTQRWLSRRNPSYRDAIQRQVGDFANASRQLHTNLVRGTDVQRLRTASSALYTQWGSVQRSIDRCDTEEKYHLRSLSSQITPTLVELQTLMAP